MKYAVEMDSGALYHKDGFSHSKVDKGDTQIHRQHGDRISLLLFFLNKKSRLKRMKILHTS
jgi:hypothetical protein